MAIRLYSILLPILFLLPFSIFTQEIVDLIPYRNGESWGFCDSNKKVVINAQFDHVDFFRGNHAFVMRARKKGLIKKDGNYALEPIYDDFRTLENGLFIVKLDGKWGIVNQSGETVLKSKYPMLQKTSRENHYLIRNEQKQFAVIDQNGKIIIPFQEGSIYFKEDGLIEFSDGNGKWGLRDYSGKELVKADFNRIKPIEGKWSYYIDKKLLLAEKWIQYQVKYKVISNSDEAGSLESLLNDENLETDDKNRIIYKAVSKKQYEMLKLFGKIPSNETVGKPYYGLIDSEGKFIAKPIYNSIELVSNQLIRLERDGKFGLINLNGKRVLPLKYDQIGDFNEGKAICAKDSVYGFIDEDGKVIIDFQYKDARDFGSGHAAVKKNDYWGLISSTGEEKSPFTYDIILNFREGMAPAVKGDVYGFIDTTGKEVISPQFYGKYGYGHFFRGKAIVRKQIPELGGTTEGVIDLKGNIIIPFIYQKVEYNTLTHCLVQKLVDPKKRESRYGFIDTLGRVVIPIKFKDAKSFGSNYYGTDLSIRMALVWADEENLAYYIDEKGNKVNPLDYTIESQGIKDIREKYGKYLEIKSHSRSGLKAIYFQNKFKGYASKQGLEYYDD